MTKSEIIGKFSKQFNLPPKHARLVVESFINNMIVNLAAGDKVILRGLGTFSVKVSKARLSRNPQTGVEIFVKSRRSLTFKAGRSFLSRINSKG